MRVTDLARVLGGRVVGDESGADHVAGVQVDSRRVEPGDLFVAASGAKHDGARFAPDALARGASAILCDRPLDLALRAPLWIHPEARRVSGLAAALVHGEPARGMFVAGITGTNGKTTTAHVLGHLLRVAGRKPAVLGTAGNRLADGALRPASHTTPDGADLWRLIAEHRRLGGDAIAMEVSSHALDQNRVAGLRFDVAIFTNLTRDHLDYHGDLEHYARSKERLFRSLDERAACVVNADDPASARMAEAARARGARVLTYSARSEADLRALDVVTDLGGTTLALLGMGVTRAKVRLPLAGGFNVENALAAAAAALLSGASTSKVLEGLATVSSAPGRLESVATHGRGFALLVDYAHTEDALENVCRVLRATLERAGRGRLIVVFGCGGDRDRGKRAPMGRVASELADLAIVTSDNPRSEDPRAIALDVESGMLGRAERLVELDRRRAIELAVARARPDDVVLVAGKGHETTQTIGAQCVPFDDRTVAAEILR